MLRTGDTIAAPIRGLDAQEEAVAWAFLNEVYRGRYGKTTPLGCDKAPSMAESLETDPNALWAGISSYDVLVGNMDKDPYPDALVTYNYDDCYGGSGVHGRDYVYYRGVPGNTFVHGQQLTVPDALTNGIGPLVKVELTAPRELFGRFHWDGVRGEENTGSTVQLSIVRDAQGGVQVVEKGKESTLTAAAVADPANPKLAQGERLFTVTWDQPEGNRIYAQASYCHHPVLNNNAFYGSEILTVPPGKMWIPVFGRSKLSATAPIYRSIRIEADGDGNPPPCFFGSFYILPNNPDEDVAEARQLHKRLRAGTRVRFWGDNKENYVKVLEVNQ